MDSSSMGAGFMAVFVVSGSVVLLALQVHKRLLSDFMKKIDSELGSHKDQTKKKVRFAADVVEPSSDSKVYRQKHLSKVTAAATGEHHRSSIPSLQTADEKLVDTLPLNWQVLYKGLIESKALKGHGIS